MEACNKGIYKGIFLEKSGVNVSLLKIVNDALFFGEWSSINASNLIRILNCFEMSLGLKVNLDKSRFFGVGIPYSDIGTIILEIGYLLGKLDPSRLVGGLPSLSLFQAAFPFIIYHFSRIPFRSSTLLNPLDVDSFRASRKIMVDQLDFYGDDGGFNSPISSLGCNGTWIDILKSIRSIEAIDPNFKSSFVRKVVSGDNTTFWHNPWCGNENTLKEIFLILYALENNKECKVSDRWGLVNGIWGVGTGDSCLVYDPSGLFKVRSLSKIIQNMPLNVHGLGDHHLWNSWTPRKVNVGVWRAFLNRLAIRVNLEQKGIPIASVRCPFCDLIDEDVNHVLISCPYVLPVWSWWNLDLPISFSSFSVSDVAIGNLPVIGDASLPKILHGVF
ncbi:RNA-directed DNA polymerase, eukaryota, reverse transcriptase zinc-binding domain protein [Tanacetum coccineum]